MQRIDTATAQKDKFGTGKNGFTNGNPQTGVPATDLNSAFFDSTQEEICSVIESTGVELDPGKLDQLLTAIRAIIAGDTSVSGALQKAQNLADLEDVAEGRENLGLGDAATHDASDFLPSDYEPDLTGYLPKTGGTITGGVELKSDSPTIQLTESDTEKKYFLIVDGGGIRINQDDTTGPNGILSFDPETKNWTLPGEIVPSSFGNFDDRYILGVRLSAVSTRHFDPAVDVEDGAVVTSLDMVGGSSNVGDIFVRYIQQNEHGVWVNVAIL